MSFEKEKQDIRKKKNKKGNIKLTKTYKHMYIEIFPQQTKKELIKMLKFSTINRLFE